MLNSNLRPSTAKVATHSARTRNQVKKPRAKNFQEGKDIVDSLQRNRKEE